MRRYLALVGVTAVGIAVGMSGVAVADPGNQTIENSIKPKKLKKKKRSKISLFTGVYTRPDPGKTVPPKATKTVVDFPADGKVNAKAVKACRKPLGGTTPSNAKRRCKKSLVSQRRGTGGEVIIGGLTLPAEVLAFRGKSKKDLILHSYVRQFGITTILPGKFSKAPGKKYGDRLSVDVPPLAGGAGAISVFEVTTKRKTGYVKARCKRKRQHWRAVSKYTDHPKTTAKNVTTCKKKKGKKNRKNRRGGKRKRR